MTTEQIDQKLLDTTGQQYHTSVDAFGVFNLELKVNQLFGVMLQLYKDQELGFNVLSDLCGIHYPDRVGEELCVTYLLNSMQQSSRLRIKVYVSIDKPEIPTVTGIYASANWMERETYDFYGVQFVGQPNLRRILNMDEMEEFPLRKEFPLEDPLRSDKADFQFGR